MVTYSAVGTPGEVSEYIGAFAEHSDADELMVAHQSPTTEARLRSVELLAEAVPQR
jgi:alkanesulfonate monooxygenase SsuD/methylene tetrahydromethanopterin reductase-like flavin-dependent oxidoreductase (luciferase family)